MAYYYYEEMKEIENKCKYSLTNSKENGLDQSYILYSLSVQEVGEV
jgi:hypothetical protein